MTTSPNLAFFGRCTLTVCKRAATNNHGQLRALCCGVRRALRRPVRLSFHALPKRPPPPEIEPRPSIPRPQTASSAVRSTRHRHPRAASTAAAAVQQLPAHLLIRMEVNRGGGEVRGRPHPHHHLDRRLHHHRPQKCNGQRPQKCNGNALRYPSPPPPLFFHRLSQFPPTIPQSETPPRVNPRNPFR